MLRIAKCNGRWQGTATNWLAPLAVLFLAACDENRSGFLNPAGPVASAQRSHLFEVFALTMIAVLPVLVLVPLILWRYRYRNRKATYTPNWEYSGWLELLMWGGPLMIVALLSVKLWHTTQSLDPYVPIASEVAPINVQVVGLDWKWLFIYPDLGIATVNQLGFPAGASVSLELTTDTVMQSFVIPALAGQVYAMPGMRTRLHVLADAPGVFDGENTQFNGVGFAQQKFEAIAMTEAEFTKWVARVKLQGKPLSGKTYAQVAAQSTGAQVHDSFGSSDMPTGVTYFNLANHSLFDSITGRYTTGKAVPASEQPGAVGYLPLDVKMEGGQ